MVAPVGSVPTAGTDLRALAFDSMADAVLVADDTRRYIDANAAAARLFGVPHEALLGRRIEDFAPAPPGYDLVGAWQLFIEAGHQEGVFPLVQPDGARRLVEYRAIANLLPGRHLSVLRDITERFETEQQFVKLANNLPYVVSRLDRAHRHLYVNAPITRYTGKRPSELIGLTIDEIGLGPALAAAWRTAIDQALAGTEAELAFELDTPEGHRFFAVKVLPECASDGSVTSVLAITRDVTAERLAEQERLALLVSEHQAREHAERASRLAELFLAVLSHDLRNPLSSILSGTYLLAQKAVDESLKRVARRVETSALRMSRLVEQLLDFSRIRNGQGLPHEPRHLVLDELMLRIRDELAIDGQVIKLETQGSTEGLWDGDRLAQVFSNLLGNAVEHSPPGSVVQVRLDGHAAGQVEVTVENPGTIPPEFLAEVFEPFRQGRREPGSRGLGLGLYTSKLVVEAHGGSIEVRSSEAEGTRFRVLLPREAPPAPR